jgi:F0F1-type ATP synthase membrane subunit c/vacuolar-type H+-ATPase subunit K
MLPFLRRRRTLLLEAGVYPLLILLVNLLIVAREFRVDYSAYLMSNEGSFIAIARSVASHPGDLLWSPLWDLGLPFQNTYIPGLHILVGAFSRLTGHSPALSFHQVCGLFFALGPVAVYFMAWTVTRLPGTSWFAALAYSLVSPTAWLMPAIRGDVGGPWNLRRLQILAFYGEGPHTACLFFVPLAILFLYLAVTRGRLWMKIAAGLCLGLAVLMNAFAAVILGIAALALIAVNPAKRGWRSAWLVLAIALLAYMWISPLLPPSVAADIHRNSSRAEGEYPFDAVSALGSGFLGFACLSLWFVTKGRVSAPLRMFFLFTLAVSSVVLLAYYAKCNIVPQPLRYGTTMDMALCLSAVFGGAALFRAFAKSLLRPVAIVLVLAAIVQTRHDVRYARNLIRRIDVTTTTTYHLAQWMNDHMQGQRVFVGGAHSFHFNAFTDTPQFHGGHDPMQPSMLTLIGGFVIASGMNTGSRDMEICAVWLKALGAHAFSVPGPLSDPYYRPFTNPERFEGHFPVLWRESDTTIYGVPSRSTSLAHVVPANSLVQHFPVNGLDIDEMKRYAAALEDPALPDAPFQWLNRHAASIQAKMEAGQVISIQERYMPGWTAVVNGQPRKIEQDALGLMVLKPACTDCRVTITYDGGLQWRAACLASLLVTLLSAFALVRSLLSKPDLRAG